MNRALVDRVADAVLYEGYILYPYRPSVKNCQRWTFGGLYPEACVRPGGADACANQTECLVEGGGDAVVDVVVRFLHLTDRRAGAYEPPPHPNPPPPGGAGGGGRRRAAVPPDGDVADRGQNFPLLAGGGGARGRAG